jgi:hypothetical protein
MGEESMARSRQVFAASPGGHCVSARDHWGRSVTDEARLRTAGACPAGEPIDPVAFRA